jgi:acetolactate synthase-1/2/3 large subunit
LAAQVDVWFNFASAASERSSNLAARTAGRAVVDVLEAEGVDHVFGLPGGHTIGIYDALYSSSIRHVLVRHEHAAAAMAAAYAELTGQVGICLVTAGPGATNLLTAIAEAHVGCLPIVVLAGRGATATTFRGASQEVPTDRIFAPVTKWAVRVDRTDLIVDVLRQAFAIARSGRPGPVYIDIPRDVLNAQVDEAAYVPVGRAARPAGDAGAIASAAELVAGAQRPILVAGGGAIAAEAADSVRALAERFAIPVLTTLSGRGSIPDDHPLSAGGLGAHHTALSKRLLVEADVVLGLGCRFEEMETNWTPGAVPAPDATHIQVDIHQPEIGRSVPAQLGIVGDVGAVLEQLLSALDGHPSALAPGAFATHPRAVAIAEELARIEAEAAKLVDFEREPMHPLRPIALARKVLPRDAIVGFDVGASTQHIAGAMPFFRVYEPRSTIVPSSFYGMGFVASALPAARLVHPDRAALGFVGDGSFQMALHALPVAAEHKLGVTWLVLNDRALGSIRDLQEHRLDGRYIGTDFDFQPDFASLARACGCHGEQVQAPGDLEAALVRALEANERGVPAVVDVLVGRDRLLQTIEHFGFYPDAMREAEI